MINDNTNYKIKFSRDERLAILAEVCIDNDISPEKGNYAGLVRIICLSKLGCSEATAKELTRTLTTMYRNDKWLSLINPPSQEEIVSGESGLEPNKIDLIYVEPTKICNGIVPIPGNTAITDITQPKFNLHAEMDKLASNTHPTPIKRVEPHATDQQDQLTEKQIAKILHTIAEHDTFDGVGRIILSEARGIADNKHLQIDEVISLWRRHYPLIDVESRSNVALIYWNGKDSLTTIRKANVTIQPKTPIFKPQDNPTGDVIEEDADDIPEAKE